MSSDDIAEAFNKLDQLLAVAQEAGPSIALLMELGHQQGIADQTLHKHLRVNTTIARWALRLGPDTTADRDELVDVGQVVLDWARR